MICVLKPAEVMPGVRDYGFLWWADGGQELKVEMKPGGASVVVPHLDIHSMVVAELVQPEAR